MPLSNFSGVIPAEQSSLILQEATRQSAALSLGRRIPMGTHVTALPLPKKLPEARFVNAPTASTTGRKFYTDVRMDSEILTAEEIAAIIAIPDNMIEDSTINLWNFCRPLLSEAIAIAIDNAVFFGIGAPPTWPTGGLANAANSGPPVAVDDADVVELVNQAMGVVEARGLNVTGHAGDTATRMKLRGVRDDTGALLLGTEQVNGYSRPTLYSLPITYTQFGRLTTEDFFTGAWGYLAMGVRSDIRFDVDPSAVIVDAAGAVQVSGWQDNVTPMKVWARIGCQIVKPVTPRAPAGAIPFARAKLSDTTMSEGDDEPRTASGRGRK